VPLWVDVQYDLHTQTRDGQVSGSAYTLPNSPLLLPKIRLNNLNFLIAWMNVSEPFLSIDSQFMLPVVASL